MILLDVAGITKRFGNEVVLKDTSFTQQQFQKIAICGETGSGKSTLLKIIGGLVQPDTGRVLLENTRVEGPLEKLIPGQPGIAYLSQHYELRNNYRIEELLEYGNKLPEADAQALYEICRIDHLAKRKNDQLSGGEKQRIALAKLLVTAPKLLLLDEPYSNLDLIHKNILKAVIDDIGETLQITCILTSHDPLDVLSWADEILVMHKGQIIQQNTPFNIYMQPVNEYAAGLFGSYNLLEEQTLNLFAAPANMNLNGKKLFVRPENFKLVSQVEQGIQGTVMDTVFWGSYYEITVALADKIIVIKTMDASLGKGDIVSVALPAGNMWFL